MQMGAGFRSVPWEVQAFFQHLEECDVGKQYLQMSITGNHQWQQAVEREAHNLTHLVIMDLSFHTLLYHDGRDSIFKLTIIIYLPDSEIENTPHTLSCNL